MTNKTDKQADKMEKTMTKKDMDRAAAGYACPNDRVRRAMDRAAAGYACPNDRIRGAGVNTSRIGRDTKEYGFAAYASGIVDSGDVGVGY